jgi:two-component system LytT family sensor kinase
MKKSVVVLLHLLYWGSYILLLLFIYALFRQSQPGGGRPPSHHGGEAIPYILFTKLFMGLAIVPAVTAFYTFYAFLFPRYVSKKKIGLFFVYGILTLLISGLLGEITLTAVLGGVGDGHKAFIFPNYDSIEILVAIFLSSITGLFHGVIGLTIKGFITSYNDIKLKEELNTKNFETELALMKAQINPHFLFNTINNIDVLIQKDPAKASEYLNKLSDIMRFMLYETKTEKIPLSKELAYIDKYIELQKIRTSNANYINYKVEGNATNLLIEPMLFIPFMENAFKHAENKKTKCHQHPFST